MITSFNNNFYKLLPELHIAKTTPTFIGTISNSSTFWTIFNIHVKHKWNFLSYFIHFRERVVSRYSS